MGCYCVICYATENHRIFVTEFHGMLKCDRRIFSPLPRKISGPTIWSNSKKMKILSTSLLLFPKTRKWSIFLLLLGPREWNLLPIQFVQPLIYLKEELKYWISLALSIRPISVFSTCSETRGVTDLPGAYPSPSPENIYKNIKKWKKKKTKAKWKKYWNVYKQVHNLPSSMGHVASFAECRRREALSKIRWLLWPLIPMPNPVWSSIFFKCKNSFITISSYNSPQDTTVAYYY